MTTTLPRLLLANAGRAPDVVAMREKHRGIWQCRTWSQYAADVRHFAAGLAGLGFGRGDKLAVVGDNRPRLYDAMLAAQSLGGTPLALYQDSVGTEMAYVLAHAEAKVVVAEDQEQVDKLVAVADEIPTLERIVFLDPRGMRSYGDSRLVPYDAVVRDGDAADRADPARFEAEVERGNPGDIALISYTSGTTGHPKGVMLTHAGLVAGADRILASEGWADGSQELFAYLPIAWVGDTFLSLALAVRARFVVNIPEEPETVPRDMREVGPTIFVAPPRIWENMLRDVAVRMDDATWLKRRLYRTFIERATRAEAARMRQPGGRPGRRDRAVRRLGDVVLYRALRDHLGLGRIRHAYVGGAALGLEAMQRLRGIGVNVKQVYGLTECGTLAAMTPDDDVVADAVGRPLPGVEIRIADDDEVLIRSSSLFTGYYKDPAATAAAMTADGWLRSGDAGYFDDEGRLYVLERMKDVARLADGTVFAPQMLENKLKFSPFIKEAVTLGDGRPFVAALVNIDASSVGRWADKRGLPYTGYGDLAAKPAVYDLIAAEIESANTTLPEALHIRRFVCLQKELDPDDAELTRTRKLRRRLIGERYRPLIEALYDGADQARARVRSTYEDGRVVETEAVIPVRSVDGYAGVAFDTARSAELRR